MAQMESAAPDPARGAARSLAWLGGSFVGLGVLSILAPVAATLAASLLVAAMMLVWGALGVWFSLAMRPFPEWRFSVLTFGLLSLLGLIFLVVPSVGVEVLTMLMVAALLAEGVISILIGLRLSGHAPGWVWMVANGVASFVVGLIVLIGWPQTAAWVLGLLLGLDFLATGLTLLMLRRAFRLPPT